MQRSLVASWHMTIRGGCKGAGSWSAKSKKVEPISRKPPMGLNPELLEAGQAIILGRVFAAVAHQGCSDGKLGAAAHAASILVSSAS